jgi:hypothetical protein
MVQARPGVPVGEGLVAHVTVALAALIGDGTFKRQFCNTSHLLIDRPRNT